MKLRSLLFALVVCLSPALLSAQVSFQYPGQSLVTQYYTSGGNTNYICYASAIQPATIFPVNAAATLISVAVSSNVGTITFSSTSYMWPGQRIAIGGATTNTVLNGNYAVTGVSGSTATIALPLISGSPTYTDSTMYVETQAPMLNSLAWAIQVYTYSGSTATGAYWAGLPSQYIQLNLACSNRNNY
jgi:hypothetical protein